MNSTVESLSKPVGNVDSMLRRMLINQLDHLEGACIRLHDPMETVTLGTQSEKALRVAINIRDMDFYRKVILGGSIGAAEAYMDNLWETDDLTGVIRIMVRNRDLLDEMESGLATLANKVLKLWYLGRRNSVNGSRKNIAAHYDLGNDLFELFLDPYGMYSSATFYDGQTTLDQASEDKLERICQKLDLQPSDHLLEIGTGWGGFAEYAARNYACRITTTTISRQQFEAASERIQKAGLADRVNVIMQDYRDLQGTFDKLVSIEMIEAVGHQFLDQYFEQCATLLKPNGLALFQAITIEDWRYQRALRNVDFIQRYIFPGSFIPSVSAMIDSTARNTDLRLLNLEDQGDSYASTIRCWRKHFSNHLDQVRGLGYSEEFIRMWFFYLAYCEGGFIEKSISSVQLLFAKPENRRKQWLPRI